MFQYPKGLGNTVKELDIQHASCVVPKTNFSMLVGDVKQKLPTLCGGNLSHIVLFGIEVVFFHLKNHFKRIFIFAVMFKRRENQTTSVVAQNLNSGELRKSQLKVELS